MSPEELDAIEARAKEATPGPWSETRDGVRCRDLKIPGQSFRLFTLSSFEMAQADCTFAAHAREDVPALVSALREAHAALRLFQRPTGHFDDRCDLAEIDHDGPEPFDCGDARCKAARAALGDL